MSNREVAKARSIAAILEDAVLAIQLTQDNRDYYSGYTLGAVIEDKLEMLGTEDGGSDEVLPDGNLTKFAQVQLILESTRAAVQELKEIDDFEDLEDEEAVSIGDV